MRKESSKKNSAFGVLTQDPNLVWLASHLADSRGLEIQISDHPRNLKVPQQFQLLIVDFDCLEEKDCISDLRHHNPSIKIIALTSRADLSNALSEKGVERVFLKPYLIEHLYNAILENLSKPESVTRKVVSSRASHKAKVLIVDDEIEVCEFVRDVLHETEDGEFDVHFTHDPDLALKLCQDFEPDLVIVDLKLPQISGLELIKRFKRLSPSPKDYLVFSGSDGPHAAAGFTFLPKYCPTNELVQAVKFLCQKWNLVKKAA